MSENSTKGFKLTELGALPEEWQVVRLEDAIGELKNGFASGKRDENGIVQIRMNNVTTDGRLIFNTYLKVPVPENIDYWLLKNGDFLFNNTNSIDLVGKSTIFNDAPFPCTFSNHFTRIRFKKDIVLPEIILYHFITLWEKGYFKSVAIRHVGQSAVHTDYLLKLQIPLPPLPEQRRIAEVLGTIDSAIQKVGGAIESTERLKNGLMQRLLTRGIGHERFKESEVGRVPEEWEVVRLGEKCEFLDSQRVPIKEQDRTKRRGTYPYYGAQGIIDWIDDYIFDGEFILLAEDGENLHSKKLPLAYKVSGKFWVNNHAHVLKVKTNEILIDYLIYLLNFIEIRPYIVGSAQPKLNQSDAIKIKIPLPPLPEQRRIAEILSAADRKLELERRRKEKLERIKNGLMNELLTGRKRVRI